MFVKVGLFVVQTDPDAAASDPSMFSKEDSFLTTSLQIGVMHIRTLSYMKVRLSFQSYISTVLAEELLSGPSHSDTTITLSNTRSRERSASRFKNVEFDKQ